MPTDNPVLHKYSKSHIQGDISLLCYLPLDDVNYVQTPSDDVTKTMDSSKAKGGMSNKTSPIPPTSSTAPLKRSSFNSRIKTSNIPSISSTASQKKSSCKSRAKTSKIPPTSYVPASPKDTSLNNTDNDALLAKVLSEMDKEEHDSYLRARGKNYRFTKPKSEKKEQTNEEVQCATSSQWVRVEELKKYLHFDRDIQTLPAKGK